MHKDKAKKSYTYFIAQIKIVKKYYYFSYPNFRGFVGKKKDLLL